MERTATPTPRCRLKQSAVWYPPKPIPCPHVTYATSGSFCACVFCLYIYVHMDHRFPRATTTLTYVGTYVRLALLHREAQGLRGQERVSGVDGPQQLVHDLGRQHAVRPCPSRVDEGVEVPTDEYVCVWEKLCWQVYIENLDRVYIHTYNPNTNGKKTQTNALGHVHRRRIRGPAHCRWAAVAGVEALALWDRAEALLA